MWKKLLFAALAIFFFHKTWGQSSACLDLPTAHEILHVNNLRLPGIQCGFLGHYPDYKHAGVFANFDGQLVPPVAGFFSQTVWAGGLAPSGEPKVSAMHWPHPQNFHFVAGPYGISDSLCGRWDRFWSVGHLALASFRADWADGLLDQPPPPDILAWPGRGNPHFSALHGFDLPLAADMVDLAPFFDVNSDSIYDPLDGDFPHPLGVDTALVPGKIIWNIYSDPIGADFGTNDVEGIGFQYHWTAWATACAADTSVLNDAVFFSIHVKNTSGEARDSVSLGLLSDFEIGGNRDDSFGTAPELATFYAYNSNPIDFIGLNTAYPPYEKSPPAVAWTVLNAPLFKSIFYVQHSACDPPAQLAMPNTSQNHYNFLNGQWRFGGPIYNNYYGIMPTDSTHHPVDFMFDGNPVDGTGWNSSYLPCPMHNRHLCSAYLGSMPPNASKTIDYAYSFHRDTANSNLQNVSLMFKRVAELRQIYQQHFAAACDPEPTCLPVEDCVWPGDANRDGIVNPYDVLPIGLNLNENGLSRPGPVTWAAHRAENWGQTFDQNIDLKHSDANGNGHIDTLDARVVMAFFGFQKLGYQPVNEYSTGNDVYLNVGYQPLFDPDNVQPDQNVYLLPRIANIPGLRGIAFAVEWDSLYWEIASYNPLNQLNIDTGWILARMISPNEMIVGKVNLQNDITQLGNSSGERVFLRSKALPPGTPPLTYIRLKNIKAYRADGSEILLGSWPRQFCFGGGCATQTAQVADDQSFSVFPNPAGAYVFVQTDGVPLLGLTLLDASGRMVREMFFENSRPSEASLPTQGLGRGVYFLKIKTASGARVRKVVLE